VEPYIYTYQVYCKGRWEGKTLLNILIDEFKTHEEDYYKRAFKFGAISLNYQNVTEDTIVKSGDLLSHTVHRHEPPVTSLPIKIIFENDEMIVLDKPSSLAVHPSGRFRHNTVLFILEKEFDKKNLHLIHRIDRLTSGILILGKDTNSANKLSKFVREGNVKKTYLAQVKGQFPEEEQDVNQPLDSDRESGIIEVNENGKQSRTLFKRLSYNPTKNTSIVKCKPLTGRTHQIRVHLKWLGYPIINDPLYDDNQTKEYFNAIVQKRKELYEERKKSQTNEEETPPDLKTMVIRECPDCLYEFPDPKEEELFIYLHAFSYKTKEWKYKTDLPFWAL